MRIGIGLAITGLRRRRVLPFDPDALAYIQAVEAADGEELEAGVRVAYDQFVRGCKQDGIFEAIKASCIMAGARTLSGALVPLVGPAPTNFNFVSDDYDRATGLKGDGSTKYLDSNFFETEIPASSRSISFFVSETVTTNSGVAIGTGSSGSEQQLGSTHFFARPNILFRSRGEGSNTGDLVSVKGHIILNRINLDGYLLFYDGIKYTRSGAGDNVVTFPMFSVFARGGGNLPTNTKGSFYHIGEALDVEALDARTTALMNAIEDALT